MKGNVMTRLLFCVTVLLGLGGSVWGQDASLKIKASKEAKTLFVEEKLTLSAEKTGLEANETITWSAEPAALVTLNEGENKVVVTAVATGEITIRAKVAAKEGKHGALTAEYKSQIFEKPTAIVVTSDDVAIDYTNKEFTIEPEKSYTIKATVTPLSTVPELHWNLTGAKEGLKITEKENTISIVAKKIGDYRLSVKIDGYNALAEEVFTILVRKNEVKVTPDTKTLLINGTEAQKSAQLTATVSGLTNKNVTWSVEEAGKEIVSVSATGIIQALKVGQARVVATSDEDAQYKGYCLVTVANVATGITLTPNTPQTLTLGEQETLVILATVTPEGASQEVEWSMDKEGVVKLDKGVVKALKVGVVTITATAKETALSASLQVTVVEKPALQVPTKLAFDKKTLELKEGEFEIISLIFEPSDNVDRSVTVCASPDGFVTVEEKDGKVKVTAVKDSKGAEISVVAKSTKAELTTTCKVKVTAKTTAVEDAVLASVAVMPNPFTNQIRISIYEPQNTRYALLDAQGIEVRAGILESNDTLISTSDLPAGLYLVRISRENGATKTIRLIRQ